MKNVYILLTDTGTVLTRCIKVFTQKKYNHASLSLDLELNQVYSFGRKKVTNPFNGGFVKEDIYHDFFMSAKCQVFRFEISDQQYESLVEKLAEFELEKAKYRYNLLGLIGIALHQEWARENAFFCSQFLAHIIEETNIGTFSKPTYLITPEDLVQALQPQLTFEGAVYEYLSDPQLYQEYPQLIFPESLQLSLIKRLGLPVISRFLG